MTPPLPAVLIIHRFSRVNYMSNDIIPNQRALGPNTN